MFLDCSLSDRFRFAQQLVCSWRDILRPGDAMSEANIKLAGTVQRLIDCDVANETQQAEIRVAGADFLYDELRIPNIHKWEIGTGIEVTIRLLRQAGA